MGSSSSKGSTAQLVARVKALELQVREHEVQAGVEYVVVDGKESTEDGFRMCAGKFWHLAAKDCNNFEGP